MKPKIVVVLVICLLSTSISLPALAAPVEVECGMAMTMRYNVGQWVSCIHHIWLDNSLLGWGWWLG